MQPLISICIPTYNRASFLQKTLESIVNCSGFDEEVEVVVSDNASTDATFDICTAFANKYKNIKYYRNAQNIRDSNFPLSMDRATGMYLKLMKDNLSFHKHSIDYLKECVKKSLCLEVPIFFTNGILLNSSYKKEYFCNSFSDFLTHVSYRVTAITTFGCWRNDWELIKDKTKYSKLQLGQDDWCYQLLALYNKAKIFSGRYFSLLPLIGTQRSGYNWFEVHVSNYYTILNPYVNSGLISEKELIREKTIYLRHLKPELTITYLYNFNNEWQFDTKGTSSILWKNFKHVPHFYLMLFSFPIWSVYTIILFETRKVIQKLGLWDCVSIWINRNKTCK